MMQNYVEKLQQELELKEPLVSEGGGRWQLFFGEVTISIIDLSPGFQLQASLGELPPDKSEALMTSLLRGNLFGQTTKAAYLALDESGSKVIVQLYHPGEANYRAFLDGLEDFVNVVDFWKGELKSGSTEPT